MAALRFSSVHLLIFFLLSLQVHLATDSQPVVKTLVVLSKHVFAKYSPVIPLLVAKHPDLSNAPKRPVKMEVSSIESCFDRRSFRSTKVDSIEDKS